MSRAASKPSPIGPPPPPPLPSPPPSVLLASDQESPSFAVTLRALLAPPVAEPPAPRRESPEARKQEKGPAAAQPVEAPPAPPPVLPGLAPAEAPALCLPAPSSAPTAIASPEALAQAMLRQAQVVTLDGATGLHLELETPRLARVGLDLRLAGGRIEVSFVASTADECALLRAGTASLEAALRARGLEVGSLRVALPGEAAPESRQQRQRRREPDARGEESRPLRRRRSLERVL